MARKLGAATIRLNGGRTVQAASVRARLFDLFEAYTYDGRWFTLRDLRNEYSERFGPISHDRLRREVLREMSREDCVMLVRYQPVYVDTGRPVLQVSCEGPMFEEVHDG